MFDAAWEALRAVLSPSFLPYIVFGALIGLVFGAIPGLSGLNGIAILLPIVFTVDDPRQAIALLTSIAATQSTGDTVTAVLLGVPGTAAAAATVVDGYPLARQGHAARALSASFISSAAGGLFGALCLFAVIPIARPLVLLLGTQHLLMLAIFGLSTVVVLSGSRLSRGIIGMAAGLLLATVGYAPDESSIRFGLGWEYLQGGISLVVLAMGLFGVPELVQLMSRGTQISDVPQLGSGWRDGISDFRRYWRLALENSAVGALVGFMPGMGGAVVDWLSYGYTVQRSRDRSRFGKGDIRGVIGPEAANNSKEGGAMIPTIIFGIPGSGTTAVFLGALTVLGILPGQQMVSTPDGLSMTYTIVLSLAVSNVFATAFMLALVKPFSIITISSIHRVAPFFVTLIAIAAVQSTFDWGDLLLLLILGFFGWVLMRNDWPRSPVLIGFVLGQLVERYLSITRLRYGWTWLTDPGVIALGCLTVGAVVASVYFRDRLTNLETLADVDGGGTDESGN